MVFPSDGIQEKFLVHRKTFGVHLFEQYSPLFKHFRFGFGEFFFAYFFTYKVFFKIHGFMFLYKFIKIFQIAVSRNKNPDFAINRKYGKLILIPSISLFG